MIVIKAENISKEYTLAHQSQERYTALRDIIAKGAKSLLPKFLSKQDTSSISYETFWALKDIDFEIKQGDRVGIIGRNGAGKSTLLKILSRITEPTLGRIAIRGKVASLLEVGTGFHPELTGRENIFLNGAILGMKKVDIKRKFDEIVEFADVTQFLDTPVKRYSSGMYVRLAFAVAAHLEPEILIVDEVLAVGDAEFQKKCLGKMKEVSGEGRTVLFVSHNMQAISTLTTTSIVLYKGCLKYYGSTQGGINEYLQLNSKLDYVYKDTPSPYEPKVTEAKVITSEPENVQAYGKHMNLVFTVSIPKPLSGAALSFQIINNMQQSVTHILILDSETPFGREEGSYDLTCEIPKVRLYPGHYSLIVHFAEKSSNTKFQTIENICPFEVVVLNQIRDYYWHKDIATYVEDSQWKVNKLIAH